MIFYFSFFFKISLLNMNAATQCPCQTSEEGKYILPLEMWCEKCITNEIDDLSKEHLTYILQNWGWLTHEFARFLIDHGADPNVIDDREQSLLYQACIHNDIEFVRLFTEKCDNINKKDQCGISPLYRLCSGRGNPQEKRRKCIRILIESGKLEKSEVDFVKSKIKSKARKAILDEWEYYYNLKNLEIKDPGF